MPYFITFYFLYIPLRFKTPDLQGRQSMPFAVAGNNGKTMMDEISYVMKSKAYPLKKALTPLISDKDIDTLFLKNRKKGSRFDGGAPKRKQNGGKKILIADDDPATIDVLTMMLLEGGYEVYASGNAATITDIDRIHPDLILLDILMSGVNGGEICKELKNRPSTKHIPVIMISASNEANEIALRAHADDLIIKPFEMYTVLHKVAGYIPV